MFKLLRWMFTTLIIAGLAIWLGLYIRKYGFDTQLIKDIPEEAKKILGR